MNKWQKLFAFGLVVGVALFCVQVLTGVENDRKLAEKRSSPQGRLPDTVVPLSYSLTLRIDPEQSHFSGVVKINLEINKAINEIWLHGQSIQASKIILKNKEGSKGQGSKNAQALIQSLNYKEMGHSGVVRLSANHTILPQTAELEIHYSAPFETQLSGLYKVEENNLSYIFSQFESIDARKVFPGFDEPRFKVPFQLALEIKQSDKGFANTPQIDEQTLAGGFKRLTFATTKPLPTYLLAFAVGDFDVVTHEAIPASANRAFDIPLRGIAVKGKGDQLAYALNNTADIVTILEDYFGTAYPYKKLDLVAVPDFSAGAMENAGLITYREQLLLLGDSPSYAQQREFASIHAHELAHQWFGNLVTMRWWDDIWLNEAFATWMGHKALNQWQPKFEFSRSLIKSGHQVMAQDALVNARQIREPIINNDVIESAFNRITYQKGGAVLQMFERFIGPEIFRQGVQYHMKRFAYGHADADEFIESIEQVSGKPGLKAAFFSFLTQPGVPKVELDWQCSGQQVSVKVKQSRYLPLGSDGSVERKWHLPVCLSLLSTVESAGNSTQPLCAIVTEVEQVLETQGACPVAIMPNYEGKGYYRFSYDKRHWESLLGQLAQLSAAEKYAVADNLAAAFRAGDVDANFYLTAVQQFIRQSNWDLVAEPLDELKFIADYIANPAEKLQLTVYLDRLYRPLLDKLGLEANTEQDRISPVATSLLRRDVVNFMALRVKAPELCDQLLTLAQHYIGYQTDNLLDPTVIAPDLVVTALMVALESLGQPYFDALQAQIEASSDSMFRQRGLTALGGVTDPLMAQQARNMVLSLSIKNNERGFLIRSQLRQIENHPAVYDWLKTYFGVMSTLLPQSVMASTPRVANGFCSKAQAEDVEAFFSEKTRNIAGAERQLAMALERINICIAIKDKQNGLRFADLTISN